MDEPFLLADQVRVDVSGVPAIDGLSFETKGEHVLVLGAPRALFEAASGIAAVARGRLLVRGVAAEVALRTGKTACAPLDPPLPPTWSPREYVTWSARLAGRPAADARGLARDAIERMKLGAIAQQPLGKAVLHARRATVIAGAIATGAETLLLEDPLSALPDEVARTIGRVLALAVEDRTWAVFASRVPLVSPLATHADEALLFASGTVVSQGPPAELATHDRSFAVRIHGSSREFARRVEDRGGRVDGAGARLTVDLGESLTTTDLIALAMESSAVVLELRPVGHAFA